MTNFPETVRVFVAIDIPNSAKAELSRAVDGLKVQVPAGVRWVDPAGIHLTLKFLGDVDRDIVSGLFSAMAEAAGDAGSGPFQLGLTGLGVFPNAREPRVIWAGVSGDMDALGRLQTRVDEAVSRLGFALERRPFRPHLTLGRVRDRAPAVDRARIGEVIQHAALPNSGQWTVREIHLIRSTLTPNGAIYDSLGAATMTGKTSCRP